MRCDTISPINNTREPKIGDEFLKILRDNAFNGMDGGDVTDHIARIIEITEWIKIPDINKNQLRVQVFSKSLSDDANKWWDDEVDGTTISWDELKEKFFHKYYPLSKTCNSLASKFDNHWEIDKTTRCGLWEFYMNERTKGTIGDLHDEPRDENSHDLAETNSTLHTALAKVQIARTSSKLSCRTLLKRIRLN
ncbi:hypothetical protein Tco_1322716, partial [Tanacetum coccineum]